MPTHTQFQLPDYAWSDRGLDSESAEAAQNVYRTASQNTFASGVPCRDLFRAMERRANWWGRFCAAFGEIGVSPRDHHPQQVVMWQPLAAHFAVSRHLRRLIQVTTHPGATGEWVFSLSDGSNAWGNWSIQFGVYLTGVEEATTFYAAYRPWACTNNMADQRFSERIAFRRSVPVPRPDRTQLYRSAADLPGYPDAWDSGESSRRGRDDDVDLDDPDLSSLVLSAPLLAGGTHA